MKRKSSLRVVGVVLVLFSCSVPVLAAPSSTGGAFLSRYSYDPAVVYAGTYGANILYYHNPRNPNWYRGFRKELNALTCLPAIAAFRSTGTWKGHLKQDGSCGDTAEPVDWAVGNRLNFERVAPPSGL